MNNKYKNIIRGIVLSGVVFTAISCEPELDDLSLQNEDSEVVNGTIDVDSAVDDEIVDPLEGTEPGIVDPTPVIGEEADLQGGDFEPVDGSNSGGYIYWRDWSDRGDYSNNPFASTSTGSDGGRGAKWDAGHSRLLSSQSDIRIAYQELTVTAGTEYTIQFDARVDTAGDYIEILVLDGHAFTPTTAIASTPLLDASTTDTSGSFVTVSQTFTANSTGQVAIMMSAFIANTVDGASVYLDNMTVSPSSGGGGVITIVGDPVSIDGFDFEPVDGSNSGGYIFWRWTDREDYSNNPYASTSTGSDGGRGAKWDAAHSRLNSSLSDVRTSYQALNVTAGAQYTIEYDARVDTAGDYIEVLILDGHFDTPTLAIASTPLYDASTTDTSGSFVTVSDVFTANSTGEIAIMMSAFIADISTGASVYLDNISITPVE